MQREKSWEYIPEVESLYISDRGKVDNHQKSFRSRNENTPYFLRRTQLISTMKLLIFVLVLSCAVVYASADLWKPEPLLLPTGPILSYVSNCNLSNILR